MTGKLYLGSQIVTPVISVGEPSIDPLTVTPSTSQQTITASGGVDGYSPITVNAVTSSIDANITAGNIKNGVSILGVTGTYSGGGGSSKYGCTIDNLLGDVDANGKLQMPADTSGNIVFSGVEDVGDYALYLKYYNNQNFTHAVEFPDLETVSGTSSLHYTFYGTNVSSVSLPKLKIISGTNGMYGFLQTATISSVSLPELETVSGNSGIRAFVSGSRASSISFPKLKTVTGTYTLYQLAQSTYISTFSLPELITAHGNYAFGYMFSSCSLLETAYFPKLSDISGSATFGGACGSCLKITDIYFNSLTTTSFGSNINQFNNMFNNGVYGTAATSGTCTVHFPSNLSSTISGLTGYPTFGGDSGRIVLSFDLPSTS